MIWILLVLMLGSCTPSYAATLMWDQQPVGGGPLIIERADATTAVFTVLATVPQGTAQYTLTPGLWGYYRVRSTAGPSNMVRYSADLYSGGLVDRLDRIELRISTLEQPVAPPPAPTSNFTITPIDADHVRLVCNGIGITTSGSGTSRTLECRH